MNGNHKLPKGLSFGLIFLMIGVVIFITSKLLLMDTLKAKMNHFQQTIEENHLETYEEFMNLLVDCENVIAHHGYLKANDYCEQLDQATEQCIKLREKLQLLSDQKDDCLAEFHSIKENPNPAALDDILVSFDQQLKESNVKLATKSLHSMQNTVSRLKSYIKAQQEKIENAKRIDPKIQQQILTLFDDLVYQIFKTDTPKFEKVYYPMTEQLREQLAESIEYRKQLGQVRYSFGEYYIFHDMSDERYFVFAECQIHYYKKSGYLPKFSVSQVIMVDGKPYFSIEELTDERSRWLEELLNLPELIDFQKRVREHYDEAVTMYPSLIE